MWDSSKARKQPLRFRIATGQVISGLDQAVSQLSIGSRAKVRIPPELAYGERGFPVFLRGLFQLGTESLAGGVLVGGGLHGELVAQLVERRLVSALGLGLERLDLDVGGGLQGGSKLRDGGGDGLSLLGLKLGLEGRLLALQRSLQVRVGRSLLQLHRNLKTN